MSLTEVIVSLLLFSLMLFNVSATQLNALHRAKSAVYAATASQQIQNIATELAFTKGQSVMQTLHDWNEKNKIVLPQGRGKIQGSYPNYVITIYWGDDGLLCQANSIDTSGCLQQKIIL